MSRPATRSLVRAICARPLRFDSLPFPVFFAVLWPALWIGARLTAGLDRTTDAPSTTGE